MATAIEQTAPTMRPEEALRRTIEQYARAVRTRSLDQLAALQARGFAAFDATPPLRVDGRTYLESWQKWLASFPGSPIFEIHDLAITASEQVGFAHALVELGNPDDEMRVVMRWTLGLVRWHGSWLISHEHVSAPFEMESGRARTDLRP